jgi:uncharacterized protein with PQ loop repeat
MYPFFSLIRLYSWNNHLIHDVIAKIISATSMFSENVMETDLPTIAGFVSTGLFALGTLPMLTKAFHTHNLASYTLGNILMSNIGNIIYLIYVFKLPFGPIWFLHGYNLISTALMLTWYLKYEGWPCRPRSSDDQVRMWFLPARYCRQAL